MPTIIDGVCRLSDDMCDAVMDSVNDAADSASPLSLGVIMFLIILIGVCIMGLIAAFECGM